MNWRCAAWQQGMGLAALARSLRECRRNRLCGTAGFRPRAAPADAIAEPHRCVVSGTGLTHLGSAAARDAMHQQAAAQAAGAEAVTDSGAHVPAGARRVARPARAEPGASAGMVLQGQRQHRERLRPAHHGAGVRPGLRRGTGAGGPVRDFPGGHAAATGLRAWATNSPTMSPSAPTTCTSRIPSCANAAWGRNCAPAGCRATWKAPAASAATGWCVGRSPS